MKLNLSDITINYYYYILALLYFIQWVHLIFCCAVLHCSVVVLRYGHAHKESVKSEYDGLLYLTVRE